MKETYEEMVGKADKREVMKKKVIKKMQYILFFPLKLIPKNIRHYIIQHCQDNNKVTLISELCSVIGLVFSIAIFIYAQEISNQQNEMERTARKQEINYIIDNGMTSKLILLQKDDKYRKSKYKKIFDRIINVEYLFLTNVTTYKYLKDEWLQIVDEKEAEIYLDAASKYIDHQKIMLDKIVSIRDLIADSSLKKDTIFMYNALLYYKSFIPKMKTILAKSATFTNNLAYILKRKNRGDIDKIGATNLVLFEFKKSDYFMDQISLYRENNEFCDYVVNHILYNYEK